ncbi:MAG TPA: anti-sigma regulatory factor [Vicinamibacteria bacterium]|nr:anti-sigma regulatory factor [Vicinamibacteria bacterium]
MNNNTTRIRVTSELDIVRAREKGRTLAAELGFSSVDLTAVATAISELARNIVIYAHLGDIVLQPLNSGNRCGLLVVASDEGPGIADVSRALQDGYSSSGSLGLGLPGTRRLMDEFEIFSQVGKGTRVTIKKWKR